MLYEVLLVSYLIVALMLIGFVLIQQGKGAGMGASFGAGGSNTVFGSSGSGNFMTRTTGVLATLFFLISLILGNLSANRESAEDEWNNLEVPATQSESVIAEDIPSDSMATQPADSDVPVGNQTVSDVPVTETNEKEKGDK
ncbi:preprotein translocase subunit SecG [Alteromonas sp. ASW11-130]|uniref:preprotein translocase subunit SecG n=1 Tax=Alteromonas sp. ASW11-130 TaxID=3015775 RepID=UPI002241C5B5|nr:preprotein translocase subunit SecG [Alteromonas sp. ASW11-130]MCW8092114.1 preprotein translocase subunit SecG [Alteromonas sp. ASW11-130]